MNILEQNSNNKVINKVINNEMHCNLLPLDIIIYILNLQNEKRAILEWIISFQESYDIKYLQYVLENFSNLLEWDLIEMILEVSIYYNKDPKFEPIDFYIHNAIYHYLKWLQGARDESHDRAFVWSIIELMRTINKQAEAK